MKITEDKEKKRAEIWLTSAESGDLTVKEALRPYYKKYREMKYLVVVFCSGDHDLVEQTTMLLRHNKTV